VLGSFGCQHGLRLSKDPKIVGYYNALLDIMVPKERIELSRHCWRGILNPLRLPFRHLGFKSCYMVLISYSTGANLSGITAVCQSHLDQKA
jgi:hypothetical protein